MLRSCAVIAVEGTHASGKTTLVHALAAHYRSSGVHVTCADEPARTSPLVEEIVLHGSGDFDLITEVDLFAAQLTTQIRAARHHTLLIADKTIVSVLAYAQVLLGPTADTVTRRTLAAMGDFCHAWAATYDLVILCSDQYDEHQNGDRFRSRVTGTQDQINTHLRAFCADTGLNVLHLPRSLTTTQRVDWISNRIRAAALLPPPHSAPADERVPERP